MYIKGSIFDPLRPDRATQGVGPAEPRPVDKAAPVPDVAQKKSDHVQISDAGRSMASRLELNQRADFDPERIAEIRTKVLTGAYNTLDVVDQVARRILTRGDL